MSISAGLVGLPNVGKSTLFNALTKSSVPAENYPFCTINPHIACTIVQDDRETKLQKLYKSEKIVPTSVQFVDIAGLVKGAASGEGLGNQFLSHIREVDLILHVLRCFEDPNIVYSRQETIDPLVDFEIITTELMLKDLDSVNKRKERMPQLLKAAKSDALLTKELNQESIALDKLIEALNALNQDQVRKIVLEYNLKSLALLSSKNYLIIANVSEDDFANQNYINNQYYQKLVSKFGKDRVIPVSAKIEQELSVLGEVERQEMESMLGITQSGLQNIIGQTYKNLGLITFFTCGPKEIHAWPIKQGLTIRKAAGEIHSDLERGFICAEVFNCQDLFKFGTESALKDVGKIRVEGQDYIVQDGDIVFIKFNV